MGSAAFVLASCDKPEKVGVFASVQECVDSKVYTDEYCRTSFDQAKSEHAKVAPKYLDKAQCEAEYGVGRCERPLPATGVSSGESTGSFWTPLMMGYMVGHMMGNQPSYAQPLYRNASSGSWFTASNVNVGRSTGITTASSSAWRTSTPSTHTVARGGFGSRASSVGVSGG